MNLNRTDEALEVINQGLKNDPTDAGGLFASAQAILLAKQGDEAGATNKIQEALKHRKDFLHSHHAAYNVACAYALLNKTDLALQYLRQVASDGLPCFPLFEEDKNLINLHHRRDFEEFLTEQKALHDRYKTEFGGLVVGRDPSGQ